MLQISVRIKLSEELLDGANSKRHHNGLIPVVPASEIAFFEDFRHSYLSYFGGELDARQFIYHRPSNILVTDDTDLYLRNVSASAAKPSVDDYR